jgi:hypothetical protein
MMLSMRDVWRQRLQRAEALAARGDSTSLVELGYLITALKITPVLQLAIRDVVDTTKGDEKRWSLGANYWWAAHNANIKAAFMRIDPTGLATQKEFTIQLQFFYY